MDLKHQGVPRFAADAGELTHGPRQPALYANQPLHPTKQMQANMLQDAEKRKLQEMSIGYGSHMAMRHVIEAQILGQVQRPSGHRSNMFGLNMHLGRYHELDAFDILNDPNSLPDLDKVGQRARMEQKLQM